MDLVRRLSLLTLGLIACAGYVNARVVTLTFDSLGFTQLDPEPPFNAPPSSYFYRNIAVEGFRISPACRGVFGGAAWENVPAEPFQGNAISASDATNCLNSGYNPNYLGGTPPYGGTLYFDFWGTPFSLEGLSFLDALPGFPRVPQLEVTTSKGTSVITGDCGPALPDVRCWRDVDLRGAWSEGITWFSLDRLGATSLPVVWIDNIRLRVPTGLPIGSTLALGGLAMLALVGCRRRRVSSMSPLSVNG